MRARARLVPMGDFDKRLERKKQLTPSSGFNVVGVDSFETDPGSELFLVGHFPDKASAEKALAKKQKQSPGERFYIYGPND